MLKFIRNHVDKIEHINIYPIVGLFIFIIFFVLMVFYVKHMSKEQISELSHMPLDTNEENNKMNL
ncbi:MAG: hypothetical protein ACO29O_06215 [Chitinophagaceae bacterium]